VYLVGILGVLLVVGLLWYLNRPHIPGN